MESQRPRQNTVLCFEINGKSMAIDLNSVAAAACDCPMVFYEGLPKGVQGVVQWAGKIFPIFDIWNALKAEKNWKNENPMFIFSSDKYDSKQESQFAIPLPYDVQLIHPKTTVVAPKSAPNYVDALIVTPDDKHAELLNIHKLIQATVELAKVLKKAA